MKQKEGAVDGLGIVAAKGRRGADRCRYNSAINITRNR